MTNEPHSETTIPPEAEERELCPSCLTGNVPGRNFCKQCGAPLSPHAAIGPFERLFAEGHIYRTATERPHKFIVVLGIWVIFGSGAFVVTMSALSEWEAHSLHQQLLLIGLLAICVTLIVKTTRNYIALKRSNRSRKNAIGS